MTWIDLLNATLLLFAVVNPIGSIPIFLQLTDGMTADQRARAFRTGALTSAAILLAFVIGGEGILGRLFQVELADLKAAGGLLLLVIAIDHLVFGALVRGVLTGQERDPHQIGAVPIGCPILAGPGAMMAVLVTLSQPGGYGFLNATVSVAIVIGITWLIFLFIGPAYRLLGRTLCTVLSKILCLFIAAIGMRFLIDGLRHYFK